MLSQQTLGLIIGGVVPAIFFGICNVFARLSTDNGIGLGWYLISIGSAVVGLGVVYQIAVRDPLPPLSSGFSAFALGLTWGIGMFSLGFALLKYKTPISKLVPIFNMNTIIAVTLALIIFKEWGQVSILKLLLGAILVVIGGTLAALA